jgi:hypothetical protein
MSQENNNFATQSGVYGQPYPQYQQQPYMQQQAFPYQPQQPMYQQPMINNGFFGAYQQPQVGPYTGYQFNAMAPVKMTNPLMDRARDMIKAGAVNSLAITQEDLDKAVCTHRLDDRFTIHSTNNPDKPNEVECDICHAVFEVVTDVTTEQINNAFDNVYDALNTMKMMYTTMPDKLATEFFQILPVIVNGKKMWKICCDQFNKFVDPSGIGRENNGHDNVFQRFNANFTGAAIPVYNQQVMPQQPVYQQTPVYQQPMQMTGQQYVPQMQGSIYGVQPGTMGQPAGYPVNAQAMAMTQNAPGMQSNGFGVTSAPVNLTGNPNATATPNPAEVPEGAPKVQKQLQA